MEARTLIGPRGSLIEKPCYSDTWDYETSHTLVGHCLYKYYGLDPDLKEDLYQEGLIAAWQTYEKYGREVKKPLVRRVIQNRMVDFLRKFGQLVPGRDRHGQRPPPVISEITETTLTEEPLFAHTIETLDLLAFLIKGLNTRELLLVGNICYPDEGKYDLGHLRLTRSRVYQLKRDLLQKLRERSMGSMTSPIIRPCYSEPSNSYGMDPIAPAVKRMKELAQ